MALNKAGILLLADDLIANKKKYNQSYYGIKTDCGTVGCLAGFCHRRKIGARAFNKLVKDEGDRLHGITPKECVPSGIEQLGIKPRHLAKDVGIFGSLDYTWPYDIRKVYHKEPVIAALIALQRMKADGNISDNPRYRGVKIPQLAILLANYKKKHGTDLI